MRLEISESGRHFVDEAGKPVFWLGDTAWNGALKATFEEWEQYLEARARQGFTVIQFVLTHWRGAMQPRHGRIFDEVDGKVVSDDKALAEMDRYIEKIVECGMIPAPVMFWTNNPKAWEREGYGQVDSMNPLFSEAAMKEIGPQMVDRWQKHRPLWILYGDGDCSNAAFAALWRRVGRAIFADRPDALVTTHPCGVHWAGDQFAREDWFRFLGIQSGHGNSERDTRWHTSGPYSYRWSELKMPFIDLEPNYEAAKCYFTELVYSDFHVRRASYWSLLGAPTAGVTYGTTSIWGWLREEGEVAEGHGKNWTGKPWSAYLESPGIESVALARRILERLPWAELRPADQILVSQPGWEDHQLHIKAAQTEDGRVAVIYMPQGGELLLQGEAFEEGASARWIDPRTGEEQEAKTRLAKRGQVAVDAPDERDWLLVYGG